MVDAWRHMTVDEIKARSPSSIAIGPFGSRMKADRYTSSGVRVIRGNNISDIRTFTGEFVHVSEATAEELRSSRLAAGDLVFPHRGAIGEVGMVPSDGLQYLLSTSLMKLSCNSTLVDPLFAFYFFRSPQGRHQLLRNTSTVGTPGISTPLASLRSIGLPVPTLPEQRDIARVLGSLDEKIDLNRRVNETLEAMVRTVFKSWFVDFEPVRTKAEGRRPAGMGAKAAALFPDSFEESEVGQIPKGWRLGRFDDVSRNQRDVVGADSISEGTPYVGLEHMPRKSVALAVWGFSDRVQSSKSRFQSGDVLFGKLRPYFHKVVFAPVDGVCSTDILVIRPTCPEWAGFVLGHASSDTLVAHADASSTGTKMPRTSWRDLARFVVLLPDITIAAAFNAIAAALTARIRVNIFECQTLAALRDALLPRLLSGEVRVADCEHLK